MMFIDFKFIFEMLKEASNLNLFYSVPYDTILTPFLPKATATYSSSRAITFWTPYITPVLAIYLTLFPVKSKRTVYSSDTNIPKPTWFWYLPLSKITNYPFATFSNLVFIYFFNVIFDLSVERESILIIPSSLI